MKKILFVAVLIFGYHLPTYSQIGNSFNIKPLQTDTSFSDLPLRKSIENHSPVDRLGLNPSFRNPMDDENSVTPAFRDNLKLDQDQFSIYEEPLNSYNMPLAEPEGIFPMPIDRPDSTANYTLQIKDF